MIIRHRIELKGRNYVVTLLLDDAAQNPITPLELEKLNQFGPMTVARGGVITPNSGSPVTLPTSDVYLPSDFPVRQTFNLDDYANAASLAAKWYEVMATRIQTALNTLLEQTAVVTEGSTTFVLND